MKIRSYFDREMFKGKTVFITGGGSGINLGIAKNFAAVGANIGICGRKQERLDNAARELGLIGAEVVAHAADVRKFHMLEEALERTRNELGPVDVLVCGAAGNFPISAEEMSAGGFKVVVDIDLIGSFNAARAAFPQLKETKGNIVFVSAGMSFMPYAYQAHVGAAKAGIDNLMKNLALEWGKYGIRSNSVVPGPIEGTEGMKRLAPGDLGEKLKSSIPLGRFGTVDEIGPLVVFLASPLASYITGSVVVSDGGQNLPGSGVFNQILAEAAKEKE
ncbi:MAG: SDR family oxidoreductase [Ignavibacteria bacterium]|nr:SDR family oxidoreductase [Ignavibacteria bacterium]